MTNLTIIILTYNSDNALEMSLILSIKKLPILVIENSARKDFKTKD